MTSIYDAYPGKFAINHQTGCWEWFGYRMKKGYGQVRRKGKGETVHRLSWQMTNGEIPNGLWVLHRCNNARCGNPEHLYLGTHADNMRDMKESGRRRGVTHGERSGRAKLTEERVLWLRVQVANGRSRYGLAKELGVSKGCVQHAVNGLNWKHLHAQNISGL